MRFLLLAALTWPLAVLSAPAASSKPQQIRSDQDPTFHLYLQTYPKNSSIVALGPVGTSEYFNIGSTIQSTNTSMYINIGADTTSYKTLTYDKTAVTKAWAMEGDTIITATSSSYGRQLNFVVCKLDGSYWQVYLQTGSATPSGRQCGNYNGLHLPCLC